jgi:hypothetical protein
MAQIYFLGANAEAIAGNDNNAISMLEKYVEVCTNGFFPFELRGDKFFNAIDDWLDENAITVPRDEAVIKASMLDILSTPAFDGIRTYSRYIELEKKLKDFAEGK